MMSLLSEIEFGSFLVFSPKGTSPISQKSRVVRDAIKNDGYLSVKSSTTPVRAMPFLVKLFSERISGTELNGFFGDNPMLVPAPRSSPVTKFGLYPAKIICQNLVECGLGKEVQPLLERAKAVPKAAFQKNPDDRPTIPMHYASMRVVKELGKPNSIVVVDDVITSGAMLIASASKLKDSFPDSIIRAFALMRTMSGIEVPTTIEICRGVIRLRSEERSLRTP
jgi:hypothetical protein